MKTSSTIVAVVCFILRSTKLVGAEWITRVIFNTAGYCSPSEVTKISDAIGPGTSTIRARSLLRYGNETKGSRALATQSVCKGQCAGFVTGYCYHTGSCIKRRGLHETGRDLQATSTLSECEAARVGINQRLDALRSQVSASCKTFLGYTSTRNSHCFQDNILGQVLGARLWHIPTYGEKVVLKDFLPSSPPGYAFCRNTSINIEALNDPCVDRAHFNLTEKDNRYDHDMYEMNPPYTLFGDDGDIFRGTVIRKTGAYTLKIVPDYRNDAAKSFYFTLLDC